jgi:hypothetical protein
MHKKSYGGALVFIELLPTAGCFAHFAFALINSMMTSMEGYLWNPFIAAVRVPQFLF